MAKETFYFTHDYNARNDDKVLELRSIHGAEGYGVFWMVVETMAENSNGGIKVSLIGGLSLGYGVAKDTLMGIFNTCIKIGLFYEKDGFYFSKRMLSHKELRNKLSLSGKAGAEKRWGGNSLPISPLMQRKGKERKENINNEDSRIKFSIQGLGDLDIQIYTSCEKWQLKEMKEFLVNSQQNFESIAMSNKVMSKIENFSVVLQEFVNMIQGTNDYQESSQLRRYFGNWVSKKNGTLESFINESKNKAAGKKNINSWM